jgi:hypothetical protein
MFDQDQATQAVPAIGDERFRVAGADGGASCAVDARS